MCLYKFYTKHVHTNILFVWWADCFFTSFILLFHVDRFFIEMNEFRTLFGIFFCIHKTKDISSNQTESNMQKELILKYQWKVCCLFSSYFLFPFFFDRCKLQIKKYVKTALWQYENCCSWFWQLKFVFRSWISAWKKKNH